MKSDERAIIMQVLLSSAGTKEDAAEKDILTTVVAAGSFTILAAALLAANLLDTLKARGPFTVFAPPDDAFKKLPAGALESLLKPEHKEQLKAVLAYHVVSGKVTAEDAMQLSSTKTLHGQSVRLSFHDSVAMVNNANVIKADIPASNGVIHVIDTVLLPTSR
jgi:uncharacterized surface protein with fasciclin (FAS1) repeats